MTADRHEPARDPARAREVWCDRWGRDASRCQEQAARARAFERELLAMAEAVAGGELVVGRCAGAKLLSRLEHDATVMACAAKLADDVARLLEERAGGVLDVTGPDRRLIRSAGIHWEWSVAESGDGGHA